MRWWREVFLIGWVASIGCAPPAAPSAPKAWSAPTDPNAEKVVFCRSIIREPDVPRCVHELTPDQQRHRESTERLLFRGGRLVREDVVSGSGRPVAGERSYVFEYEGERVIGWSLENRNGVVRGRDELLSNGEWERYLDEQDRPRARPKSHASGARRSFDPNGRVISYAWLDHLGRPVEEGRVHELRLKRNSAGFVTEEAYFDRVCHAVNNAEGAHRVVLSVNGLGDVVGKSYFDASGRPLLVSGRHSERVSYDAYGNLAGAAFFDASGAPARQLALGAAALRYKRDDRGNEVELELLDAEGQVALGSDRYAVRQQRFDELDQLIETTYLDTQRRPIRERKTGAAMVRRLRDDRGNLVSEQFFDESGSPIVGAEGYHRVDFSYDARDNAVSFTYKDTSGNRVARSSGYSARRRYYDGDRVIREEFLDVLDQPTRIKDGYSSFDVPYADDGSEGPRQFFGLDGTPRAVCNAEIPTQLRDELTQRARGARACYDRLLRYGEVAEGRIVVELHIDSRGEVIAAKLAQNEVEDTALDDCILGVLREPYENKPSGAECAVVRIPLAFVQKR